MILTNKNGHVFLDFFAIQEKDIYHYIHDAPLTHSLVVAKYNAKYLLIFNKWKQYWELPGGMIDEGESPRECAERELYEETNQSIEHLQFKGLMKFKLKPDDRLEYGALYSGEIKEITAFQANEEAEEIVFWDKKSKFSNIDEIDAALLEYY
ncbi:NUDIX domain-containing protein [Lederbergia galactosidilytica]|uniref:Nudix hydrolase domain-containing protein n=1 Tax=Lederbergia galactosidilytica TaxID=217031 RepID=A0A0Q9Y6S5_9BACI|nr:NUDIX domain-containing protein [Lederbergia galactosidilytica]KRG11074.1 hypothetical protein ACA30_21230 [Virgibacillus soli]KRG11783.1 hypothetical protein ACA29_14525 [Lederbergia galactosidilytica]MBP1916562.1 8-oxo-dGTP diphosphatase [Lederbergia galactosidilytica]OAK71977.1 hypothetical protein ABB05_10100 [Lederbergia galactosidilytica]